MIRTFVSALAALTCLAVALAGCGDTKYELPHQVDSFRVVIDEIQPTNPPDSTGESPAKALPIPIDPVRLRVTVTAIDESGKVMKEYSRPVSFRATPGNVVQTTLPGGEVWVEGLLPSIDGVATGWVSVEKVFGEFRLWAEDSPAPPKYTLADGGTPAEPVDAGTPPYVEKEETRSYAAGVSQPIYFVKPTIADVQRVPTIPPGCQTATCKVDNRLSPFVGNFLTIEAPRPRGDMIVTSITNEGFYVTDLLAQKFDRLPYSNAIGTFGHIFVYSYSYPDGLYVGDRVTALTGTVQEFSGSTQLVFPSWVRLEGDPRPQDIPAPVVFDFSDSSTTAPSLGYRICKTWTKNVPPKPRMQSTDVFCSYTNNSLDIESLESSLVRIVNAKPSNTFVNCDRNGNSNIGLFGQAPNGDVYEWTCFEEGDDKSDCQCYLECMVGAGEFDGKICSELGTLETYGQWLVQLEDIWGVRINVSTRDALPEFDPRDFAKPEYAGCTVDLTGILRQTQAARPRWIIIARDESDVCCRAPAGGTCPKGIPACPQASQ